MLNARKTVLLELNTQVGGACVDARPQTWRHDDVIEQNNILINCQITSTWRQTCPARLMEMYIHSLLYH